MASLGVVASPLARVAATEAVQVTAASSSGGDQRLAGGDRDGSAAPMGKRPAREYDHEVTVVGFDKDGLAQESPAASNHEWQYVLDGPDFCRRCRALNLGRVKPECRGWYWKGGMRVYVEAKP